MSSIKIRTKLLNDTTQIRTLITHPMETGRRKDEQGNLIPAHYIQELRVEHNQNLVITCHVGRSISKNPYFDFLLAEGSKGDTITISWMDNLENKDSETRTI